MKSIQRLKTLILTILSFVFIKCDNPAKTYIDKSVYNKIITNCSALENLSLVIYYFDGDCSLCIARLIEIEGDLINKKDVKAIFIAKTKNAAAFFYNLKTSGVKSCVIIEKENLFNQYFRLNEIIRVNKDRAIEYD